MYEGLIDDGLIPRPQLVEEVNARPFYLSTESRVVTPAQFKDEASLFAATVRRSTGFPIPVVVADTASASDVLLQADDTVASSEGYDLHVSERGTVVRATAKAGAFYGLQTLLQLLPAAIESPSAVVALWGARAVHIADEPRFDYRGIMVDVVRSFLTVDEMKRIIDDIAAAKMNVLHLHLADDQGWRIEITNEGREPGDTIDYSLLSARAGAVAIGAHPGAFEQEVGRPGYYTQADYRELIRYADERHVQIIPEIDLPGHTNAALYAIRELNSAGASHEATVSEPTAPHNDTGDVGYSYLDPHADATFIFMRHVLGQLAKLTTGDVIHIGGDECLAFDERHGTDVFNSFTSTTVDIVKQTGKRAAGWNEIARNHDAMDTSVLVQYWAGPTDHLPVAVANGAKVIASRGSSAYLDMKYSPDCVIGLDWAAKGICDVEQYYGWDPGTFIDGVGEAGIAGVEAPLWTETVRGLAQAQFMIFPRAFAIAELGWSTAESRDFVSFRRRLGSYGARLTARGTNFYDTPFVTWSPAAAGKHTADATVGMSEALTVAHVYAPATEVSPDGRSLRLTTDESTSVGNGDSFVIDWGDGTSSPGILTQEKPRTPLTSAGAFTVTGTHSYEQIGDYDGVVRDASGETAARFTVTVRAEAA